MGKFSCWHQVIPALWGLHLARGRPIKELSSAVCLQILFFRSERISQSARDMSPWSLVDNTFASLRVELFGKQHESPGVLSVLSPMIGILCPTCEVVKKQHILRLHVTVHYKIQGSTNMLHHLSLLSPLSLCVSLSNFLFQIESWQWEAEREREKQSKNPGQPSSVI